MEQRKNIYDGLKGHYGALKTLALRAEVSVRWVTLVLKGQQEDESLLLKASELWVELEQAKADILAAAARNAERAMVICASIDSPHSICNHA